MQQHCMFESPVKQNLSQSPEGARRPTFMFYHACDVLLLCTQSSHLAAILINACCCYCQLSIEFYFYSPEAVICLALPTAYQLEIANFPYPLSFSALDRGDPFSNLWKSFTDPETRVFQAADGEDLVILACTVFDWSTHVTERRTDRQTELSVAHKKLNYTEIFQPFTVRTVPVENSQFKTKLFTWNKKTDLHWHFSTGQHTSPNNHFFLLLNI